MQAMSTVQKKVKRSHSPVLRFILKIGHAAKLVFVLTCATTGLAYAQNTVSAELTLSCSVYADNYKSKSGLIVSKKMTLKGSVLSEDGRSLVYKFDELEFWALTHMTQKLNGSHFINNFEVAIRDNGTNHFYSALSDSVYSSNSKPQLARIRLSNYHPGTFNEDSYIMLECQNI